MPAAELVIAQYRPSMVFASFVVSTLGAFVALGATPRLRRPDGRWSYYRLCAAALSLGGVGIWCAHFLGMIAFKIPVAHAYSIRETVVSFAAAVLVSGLAFWFMASRAFSAARLLMAGAAAGLGVTVMHYLGMYGIRFAGLVVWDQLLVALSIVIAIAAATAALWLAFHTRRLSHRLMASVAMAGAVAAMHYTGMAAASFYCRTNSFEPLPSGTLSLPYLGEAVFIVANVLCFLILFEEVVDHQLRQIATPAHIRLNQRG